MKPLIITDSIYLLHDIKNHPESKERLLAIEKELLPIKNSFLFQKPRIASKEDIFMVHTPKHYHYVQKVCDQEGYFTFDTPAMHHTFLAAKYAAGAGLSAIDAIKEKVALNAFCIIRPPGHHATKEQAMGFCYFNNIAIAARYAQNKGFKKVFIIDFDVHHGNGTQDIFYYDDSVFYFSTHEAFIFPGTGNPDERGLGKGEGFTFNYPLMPNSTDNELLEVYYEELPILIQNFNPDIILVSAGYDLHESDPLGSLDITYEGIKKMVEQIVALKKDKPIVFFLEGGYHPPALAQNVKNTLLALA